jgi:hypothetical protein
VTDNGLNEAWRVRRGDTCAGKKPTRPIGKKATAIAGPRGVPRKACLCGTKPLPDGSPRRDFLRLDSLATVRPREETCPGWEILVIGPFNERMGRWAKRQKGCPPYRETVTVGGLNMVEAQAENRAEYSGWPAESSGCPLPAEAVPTHVRLFGRWCLFSRAEMPCYCNSPTAMHVRC